MRAWVGLLVVMGLVVAAPGGQDLDRGAFRFKRPVELPAGDETLVSVPFDSALWQSVADDYADLRLVSETEAAPYLVRQARARRAKRVRRDYRAKLIGLDKQDDNRIAITATLDNKQTGLSGIEFVTPLRDYERSLTIYGLGADGVRTPLVSDALIYDYARFADIRRSVVDLPDNPFHRFEIIIDAVTDEAQSPRRQIVRTLEGDRELQRTDQTTVTDRPFRINAVRFFKMEEREQESVRRSQTYPVAIDATEQDSENRTTVITVNTKRELISSLALGTTERNFSRSVEVQIPVVVGVGEQWRRVGSSRVSRLSYRSFKSESLRVSFPAQRSERFRLVIANRDNPALEIESIEASGPLMEAVFLARDGAPMEALYGGGDMKAPRYDTETITRLLSKGFLPVQAAWGEAVENTGFAPVGLTWSQILGSRRFFIGVIIVVVAALAFALVSVGRKAVAAENQTSDG